MIGRNPISDLEAIAAMPGLEALAETMLEFDPPTRKRRGDPMSLLILTAARWTFDSMNEVESALLTTSLWEAVRASAARGGRELPEEPPSSGQLRHFRARADDGLIDAMSETFSRLAVDLAQQAGLLDPAATLQPDRLDRTNLIYGDGSQFRPLSDVYEDEDGVVHGSRAKPDPVTGEIRPRIATQFVGKDRDRGLPIVLVGTHGGLRWQRAVLAVRLYRDGNEIGAAMDAFERVIDLARGGVHGVNYDMLMAGTFQRNLMRLGVVPVVEMPQAATNHPHLVLPDELRKVRGKGENSARRKRSGKGRRRRSDDQPDVKSRVQLRNFDCVTHRVNGVDCEHLLWAADGSVLVTGLDVQPSMDSPLAERIRLERTGNGQQGYGLQGWFRIPCRAEELLHVIDFAADRPGKNRNGQPRALADWLRPIPEADIDFARLAGYRNDAESAYATLKRELPHNGRASALDADRFALDVIGGGMWQNAVLWDVHVAQHTRCGKRNAEQVYR